MVASGVKPSSLREAARLLEGSGVAINGPNPWDPQVRNPALFDRVFAGGTLAIGESYVDGWWEVEDLAEMVSRIARAGRFERLFRIGTVWHLLRALVLNLQSRKRAYQVAEEHYDIGNDLYRAMLDRSLSYSCGYWCGRAAARTLEEAQEAKMDLVCSKLGLGAGARVVDIGCGWGGFLIHAAERYDIRGVGITVSREQEALARSLVDERGLSCRIEIRLQDYRDLSDGPYDAAVSIGMFEHVGRKNHRAFFRTVRRLLARDGLLLLQTIGNNRAAWHMDPWFDRYIFPNGFLPSPRLLTAAAEGLFVLEDWHNFGVDYDRTLREWYKRFDEAWPQLRGKYGDRFYRMWKYYLLSLAGAFRARHLNLWQVVFSPGGKPQGCLSARGAGA